ncbi:hypothetical protein ACH5RR_018575 [Cinchona calisaya]|uniref:Uncharacterized protein n=1 Tax=Cinchona calisaya TaxID=153742 RepID=A0ABD2ZLY1_9GENT
MILTTVSCCLHGKKGIMTIWNSLRLPITISSPMSLEGIWPESEAFSDKDLGQIPSKWKAFCQSGMNFDAKKVCNKKLIGACYFIDGFLAEYGQPLNTSENGDLLSQRDVIGHGTHTASTAAGSIALNVSYRALGLDLGLSGSNFSISF